jgi:hypothetical protein
MTGFGGWVIAALGLLACSGLAAAADLSKMDRTIGKQPAYQNKPGYCLLVFGPEASTRVWLVKDGDVLYLDRNGNGDLTEAGKRLAGNAGESAGTITDSTRKKKYKVQGCNLTKIGGGKDGKEQKEYCYIAIDIDGAFRQYTVAGFADRPQDAPVVHFDGPLTFGVADPNTTLKPGDKPSDLRVYILTRGHGEQDGSTVAVNHGLGIPEDVHPVVEIEFPSKEPGGKPITAKYTLKQRC